MQKAFFRFTFKPAVASQRGLIHKWLQQDYIGKWIHGEGLRNTLNGFEKFIQHQVENKKQDRKSEITQHWIGYDEDKPFVYLLISNVFNHILFESLELVVRYSFQQVYYLSSLQFN